MEIRMMTRGDQVDESDPRSILEQAEEAPESDLAFHAMKINRFMFWILDGHDIVAIGIRAYVAAYVASPAVVKGMTLNRIAQITGCGRSMAHNLTKEFERKFGMRSIHARSDASRENYSKAFHARNGTKPHTYNPLKK